MNCHPSKNDPFPSAAKPGSESEADWSVLDIDGVEGVARNAAWKVARQYATIAEYDDLYQEAMLLLAQAPDVVRGYGADLGRLHRWLWCDLTNLASRWATRQSRDVSYEAVRRDAT